MTSEINWLDGGTVTSPKGFTAGATYAGIRTYTEDKLDLGMLCSESVCTVAGTFTTNKVKSPTVVMNQRESQPAAPRQWSSTAESPTRASAIRA